MTKIYLNKSCNTPLKAIRERCITCAGGRKLAATCPKTDCALYPYRFGKYPPQKRPPLSESENAQLLARLKPK